MGVDPNRLDSPPAELVAPGGDLLGVGWFDRFGILAIVSVEHADHRALLPGLGSRWLGS